MSDAQKPPSETEDELLVCLLQNHRLQHEEHLDYYAKHPDLTRLWGSDLDARVRLKLAQVNSAIARRLPAGKQRT